MTTDHLVSIENHQHENQLAIAIERRRSAAERAAEPFGGDRLALIAHLARAGRAARLGGPAAC